MVHEMQGAQQNECLNKQTIMWWHKAFLKGRDSTKKLNSSGQPSTSIVVECQ